MPHCENKNCNKQLTSDEVQEKEGKLLCEPCANPVTPLKALPGSKVDPRGGQVMGRDFDYGLSYTRKHGIQGHVSLGGAKLSLEVSQEEITRIFGPEAS
jgi:hypothetical protein